MTCTTLPPPQTWLFPETWFLCIAQTQLVLLLGASRCATQICYIITDRSELSNFLNSSKMTSSFPSLMTASRRGSTDSGEDPSRSHQVGSLSRCSLSPQEVFPNSAQRDQPKNLVTWEMSVDESSRLVGPTCGICAAQVDQRIFRSW